MIILDAIHLGLMALLMLGGIFFPVDMLPSLIFFQIFFLSRYHDYCVISKVTELSDTLYTGCEQKKDFTGQMEEIYRIFGINPGTRLLSNLSTALISISILVSIFRLSRQYKFSLIAHNRFYFNSFVLLNLAFVVFSEIAIDFFSETKFPRCDEMFTRVGEINPLYDFPFEDQENGE